MGQLAVGDAMKPTLSPPSDTARSSLPKLLYSKEDAAFVLSVSLRTVDNLILRKELKITKRIGARVLIHAKDLDSDSHSHIFYLFF